MAFIVSTLPTVGVCTLGEARAIAIATATPNSLDDGWSIQRGSELFGRIWSPRDGLGSTFNARSCEACHSSPAAGGAGMDHAALVHLSSGVTDPTGGYVVRQFFIGPTGRIARRALPADSALRKPPSLFGIGDWERVSESVVREYADPDDRDRDGISGRIRNMPDGIGRFGWKARFATLEHAVAAALVNELGLTTTYYPQDSAADRQTGSHVELRNDDFRALTAFVRSLAPLPTLEIGAAVRRMEMFDRVGCSDCHRPTLHVSSGTHAAANAIHPYTDLLLHDMGPALSDGIAEGDVSPQEFRTPPLWGVGRTGLPYLHDGRAKTLHDAILAHGGEGEQAATAYKRLADSDRAALLGFVMSR